MGLWALRPVQMGAQSSGLKGLGDFSSDLVGLDSDCRSDGSEKGFWRCMAPRIQRLYGDSWCISKDASPSSMHCCNCAAFWARQEDSHAISGSDCRDGVWIAADDGVCLGGGGITRINNATAMDLEWCLDCSWMIWIQELRKPLQELFACFWRGLQFALARTTQVEFRAIGSQPGREGMWKPRILE